MAKYSPQKLKAMAKTLLKLKQERDFRYVEFLMRVAGVTGTTPDFVEQKINEYANAETEAQAS